MEKVKKREVCFLVVRFGRYRLIRRFGAYFIQKKVDGRWESQAAGRDIHPMLDTMRHYIRRSWEI